jgi:hypothetical protein
LARNTEGGRQILEEALERWRNLLAITLPEAAATPERADRIKLSLSP